MSNKWREIWESKGGRIESENMLRSLLKLNGFDTKSGTFDIANYQNFVSNLAKEIRLDESKSVFEVGCGSGAFLYALVGGGV